MLELDVRLCFSFYLSEDKLSSNDIETVKTKFRIVVLTRRLWYKTNVKIVVTGRILKLWISDECLNWGSVTYF